MEKSVFEHSIMDFYFFGASFSKNRQKLLSAAVESFLSVEWCSKLYQTFPWTLRNIFHMNYVTKKCVENFLTDRKQSTVRLKKALFEVHFWGVGVWFSKNRQKLLSAAAKSFLRVVWCSKLYQEFSWTLRMTFHVHNVIKKCVDNFLRTENGAQ